MEFKRNGIVVTVADQVVERILVEKLQLEERKSPATFTGLPKIGAESVEDGGVIAGLMRGRAEIFDGADYLLVAGPEAEKAMPWAQATEWATQQRQHGFADFTLPYRKEQALLFANVPELFKAEYFWSCEQHAGLSGYAWHQGFTSGHQSYWRKDSSYLVRAVRRVPLR